MSKKSTVVVPEVVEDRTAAVSAAGAVTVVPASASRGGRDGTELPMTFGLTTANVYDKIGHQINVVKFMELRSNFEKLRLGAMVREAVAFLGIESQGGRGHEGEGVKGWWEDHFKDADGKPVIPYRSIMNWVEAAEALPKYLNAIGAGCGKSEAQIKKVLSKNPGKKFKKDELKLLASAEKAANEVTMKQLLLFGGEEDARGKRGKRGRPKGTTADLSKKPDKTDTLAAARAEWSKIIVPADRGAVALEAAAKLLNAEDVENAKIVLDNLVQMLKDRAKELKIRI